MSVIDDLRELGIMNVFVLGRLYSDAMGRPRPPAIVYRPAGNRTSPAWQIYRGDGVRTDPNPNGATLDNGRMTFAIYGPVRRMKAYSLQEAKVWAAKQYGVRGWTKHPGGQQLGEAWYPAEVIAWLNTELAKVKAART